MYEESNKTKSGFLEGSTPQMGFVFGLVTGVAVVSLAGWLLTASAGFTVGGNLVKNNNTNNANPTATQPTDNVAAPITDIAVKPGEYVRGNPNAPVTLIEYSDLECPFCKTFHSSMTQLMTQYDGKVNWVYRHFPLSFHANAQKEAEAAECVGKLAGGEKYWEYIDLVFERTTSNGYGLALDQLPVLAQDIGVNQAQFKTCLDSGEFASKVQSDMAEGSAYGVGGTPSTFVNGRQVEGAVPFEQLKQVVDQILSEI